MQFIDRLFYEYLDDKHLRKVPVKAGLYVLAVGFLLASVGTSVVSYFLSPMLFMTPPVPKVSTVHEGMALNALADSSVKEILGRNIFNREGLFPEEETEVAAYTGNESIKTTLPLTCVGIIYGGDPHSGLAILEDTGKHLVNSFFVGESVASDAKIVEILADRVIFDRGGHREYLLLDRLPVLGKKRKKPVDNKSQEQFATDPPPNSYKEDGFERNGTSAVASLDFKNRLLTTEFSKVLQDAKAEPNMVGNELQGFRLNRIRKDSIFEKLGFQNDDVVREVNGMPLSDAAQAIKLLTSLREEKEVEFQVERGGKPLTFNLQVK